MTSAAAAITTAARHPEGVKKRKRGPRKPKAKKAEEKKGEEREVEEEDEMME